MALSSVTSWLDGMSFACETGYGAFPRQRTGKRTKTWSRYVVSLLLQDHLKLTLTINCRAKQIQRRMAATAPSPPKFKSRILPPTLSLPNLNPPLSNKTTGRFLLTTQQPKSSPLAKTSTTPLLRPRHLKRLLLSPPYYIVRWLLSEPSLANSTSAILSREHI